ncbi:MAG: polyprenol monophosphomannose synthase [Planctomycetaceae bacterium]|jgi:dolichol-phosphate mannosyltransferase|nr:polyprenol monophosphomannose synthase [Planctomycetaceae bacterium]
MSESADKTKIEMGNKTDNKTVEVSSVGVTRNDVLVVLATYNERENIVQMVEQIFANAPDVDILVVDDNSPDGTGDWVEENCRVDSRLKLLRRSGKLGLGTAILDAMRYAIVNDYKYLINMDADLSHSPKYIPSLRAKSLEGGYDVVIGSRYIPGGGVEGWAFSRRWMSYLVNLGAKFLLGLKTQDNSGAFRCYKVDTLKSLDMDKFISRGYSFCEEVLFRLKKKNATFAETPIIFVDRQRGYSKINKKEAINAVLIFLRLGIFGP